MSFALETRPIAVCLLLLVATLVAAVYAMTLGRVPVPFVDVIGAVLGNGEGGMRQQIVFNLRLPRVLVALFAGASLGVSGAVFQSVSRNALGSPDVIGFTTGAATGALAQIVIFGGGPLAVALSAMLGGLITATLVYLLSFKQGATGGYRLVLTGIGAGATLNALNGLMLVKGSLDNAISANLWLAGSLDARSWDHALTVMAGASLLIPISAFSANRLRMIEMGDDIARQLGVQVERTRFGMIACAVLLAGVATGAAGPIAFLALAAPQLASRLTSTRGIPVLSSAIMGAFLLVSADLLTQLFANDLVLPIGRTTGLVGGLYLLWLLTRSKQK
ncbi:FecCD family ABC transporter permease [Agrobacterium tumefaciens]|uniref:FecCD family ABC transporter permease n=1 Tax=Agrobacterium tumefaciens TaxID=358 RepID=UPI0021CE25D8|nr:iron chelate uptake ABC transporter family permease subunit [Agrobacterium tumefaciens]UXS03453.1 iron chelate uptake ABC transporter family permease subunit [Agrobacterium tumefaciens]